VAPARAALYLFPVTTRPALAALGLALLLPSCSNTLDTPTTFPSPGPTTVTVLSVEFKAAAATDSLHPGLTSVDLAAPGAGRLDATVDWSQATSDVDIIVSINTCPTAQAAYNGQCQLYAQDRLTTKPARVTFTSTAGANYKLWIYNFGTTEETGSVTVLLTP
jgi:hypothetical protein